ncbi:MAG: PBP1A family penicillin-binding protein [Deltaproteobacteria bacterium]|nr:MAG: PBP1A family penicillin-binding protein [Deltaproteobacteria bacterium]
MAPPKKRSGASSASTSGAKKPRSTKSSSSSASGSKRPRRSNSTSDSDASKQTTMRMTKTKSAPKRPRKKPATKAASGPPRPPMTWRRWLMWEAVTWGTGAAIGLGIAGSVLWSRAKDDVEAYLADPPRTWPGVIYSAPMRIESGQAMTARELAGDLLAAGYEKVDAVDGTGQFSLSGGDVRVWSAGLTVPGSKIAGGKTRVLVRDGLVVQTEPADGVVLHPTVLATVGDREGRRTEVDLDHLSPFMEPALLSIEDSRFRDHMGVDPVGIARAVASNLIAGRKSQGGSTLTQQLAKNLFLSAEKKYQRKVREAFFAAALEHTLSKDEILELYLGEVYLGQVGGVPIHGVEQAARAYFGVSAERLSLAEAATLAGIISAPNAYSPVRHPDKAQERREIVLARMVTTGAITEAQADAAKAETVIIDGQLPGAVRRAPWAVDVAIDEAEDAVGAGALANSGYVVHTTIQPALQRAAEQAVFLGMHELDTEHPEAAGAQAALVAVRLSDGAVVAMVGGRDYGASPYNRAVNAWRNPGSTVKPLTLLKAFDDDPSLTPVDPITDEAITRKVDGKVWTPSNYDGRFLGEITIREAIEKSRNIPAVKLAETVGAGELQAFYREVGLSRATNLPSAALGGFSATPLEMAGAYTVFGGGTAYAPWLVAGIEDGNGDRVLKLEGKGSDVASQRAAALAVGVLEGVVQRGTGRGAARYGVEEGVAGKTGTTSGYRDAWFVGLTPELAVAVWVGHDKGKSLELGGGSAALPTFARFAVSSGTAHGDFPVPDGIKLVSMCVESHKQALPACEDTYDERFARGHVAKGSCDIHGVPLISGIGHGLRKIFGHREEDDAEVADAER